jgi:hypothetical protein
MEKNDKIIAILSVALVVSLFGWATSMMPALQRMTGSAISVAPISQVTVQKYFSINASYNLSSGINFGTIDVLPTSNQNASLNYNDTMYPVQNDGNQTLYFVTVEMDTNTAVDFCIRATALNTSSGFEIGIGNYTFADSALNNVTYPGPVDEQTMSTTAYVASQTNVSVGSSDYMRFWLDVPATQQTGTYNNTVTILGTSYGVPCP